MTSASPAADDKSAEDSQSSAPLPLLEFALERLWLKAVQRGSRVFQHADYDAMGGLAGAIAQHAEEVYVSLASRPELATDDHGDEAADAQRTAATTDLFLIVERIWTGLISSRGTRRPRTRSDLETETGYPETARKVIDCLVGERLLTIRSVAENLSDARVDISHEVLIERWDRLRDWLAVGAEGRALKEEFQKDAERWNEGMPGTAPRSAKNLPSAQAVDLYLSWIDRVKSPLTEIQLAFTESLHKSVQRRKRLRRIVTATSVLVAVAMAAQAIRVHYAREAAVLAQKESERAQEESERRLAFTRIQRAMADGQAGKPSVGMARLLRAYEDLHPDDSYQRSARNLMAGWNEALGYCLVHESPVMDVAFSEDGQILVTASLDGKVRIWEKGDERTWEIDYREWQKEFKHGDKLFASAISPNAKLVVTCGRDEAVRVWDVTGQSKSKLLDHNGPVTLVEFSADGRKFVTGSNADDHSGKVQAWDTETGDAFGPRLHHDHELLAVAISPDGRWVCTGADDRIARLWNLNSTAQQPATELHCGEGIIAAVAFSPDGKWAVVGTGNGRTWLWPVEKPVKGLELRDKILSRAHGDRVQTVVFSPDSGKLVTGSMDNTARLWDVKTQEPIGYPMIHEGPVLVAKFTADGKGVLTGSGDGTSRLFSASTAESLIEPTHEANGVVAVAMSPDGTTIATGTWGRVARLWDLKKRERYQTVARLKSPVTALAFNPDTTLGGLAAFGTEQGQTQIWVVSTKKRQSQQPPPHSGPVSAIAFSPDGKTLATASWDKTARLWNLIRTDSPGHQLLHKDKVTSVAFSPNGKTVLTGCLDGNVRFWDVATGREVSKPLKLSDSVLAVACSPDGTSFATGSDDDEANIWALSSRKRLVGPLHHYGNVVSLAYSPQGKRILTGSWDGTARLWETATGKQLWNGEPVKHSGPKIVSVAFSPDGVNVLTGSWEGTAQLWDANTSMARGRPMWHEPRVYAVAFNPDGRSLITGSNEGDVRVWPVASTFSDDAPRPDRIRTYVEVRTGRYWDQQMTLQPLTYEKWIKRQKLLRELGVPFLSVQESSGNATAAPPNSSPAIGQSGNSAGPKDSE